MDPLYDQGPVQGGDQQNQNQIQKAPANTVVTKVSHTYDVIIARQNLLQGVSNVARQPTRAVAAVISVGYGLATIGAGIVAANPITAPVAFAIGGIALFSGANQAVDIYTNRNKAGTASDVKALCQEIVKVNKEQNVTLRDVQSEIEKSAKILLEMANELESAKGVLREYKGDIGAIEDQRFEALENFGALQSEIESLHKEVSNSFEELHQIQEKMEQVLISNLSADEMQKQLAGFLKDYAGTVGKLETLNQKLEIKGNQASQLFQDNAALLGEVLHGARKVIKFLENRVVGLQGETLELAVNLQAAHEGTKKAIRQGEVLGQVAELQQDNVVQLEDKEKDNIGSQSMYFGGGAGAAVGGAVAGPLGAVAGAAIGPQVYHRLHGTYKNFAGDPSLQKEQSILTTDNVNVSFAFNKDSTGNVAYAMSFISDHYSGSVTEGKFSVGVGDIPLVCHFNLNGSPRVSNTDIININNYLTKEYNEGGIISEEWNSIINCLANHEIERKGRQTNKKGFIIPNQEKTLRLQKNLVVMKFEPTQPAIENERRNPVDDSHMIGDESSASSSSSRRKDNFFRGEIIDDYIAPEEKP